MTATNSPAPLMTRLLRRMERDGASGCWIWQGAQSFDGYGQIRIGDRIVGAHRAMVIAREGSIAPGMEVDHLCRTTLCINPDHLEVVTGAENLRRKYAAITHCKHGHPYDEANTINRPNGRRGCRECTRKAVRECMRRRRARERAERNAA